MVITQTISDNVDLDIRVYYAKIVNMVIPEQEVLTNVLNVQIKVSMVFVSLEYAYLS